MSGPGPTYQSTDPAHPPDHQSSSPNSLETATPPSTLCRQTPPESLTHLDDLQVRKVPTRHPISTGLRNHRTAHALPLRKPRPRHNRQPLPQIPEMVRPVRYDHDGLLHRRARHVRGPVQQRRCVQLPRAGYAEEGRGRAVCGRRLPQGEVREVFGQAAALGLVGCYHYSRCGCRRGVSYAWAPSESAMNGSSGHSFSAAGSEPSSTPIHVSTSGPLEGWVSWEFALCRVE